jgi:hypothetical protein
MPTFAFRITENHLRTGLARYRSASNARWFVWPMKALCHIGLGALLLLCLFIKAWVPAVGLAAISILLAVAPRIDLWFFKRLLRTLPFLLNDAEVAFSEKGYTSTTKKNLINLNYKTILLHAAGFSERIFLLLGLFLLVLRPRIDFWFFRNQVCNLPFPGSIVSEVEQVFSKSESIGADAMNRVTLDWAAFSKVIRFPDGFLLLVGARQFFWCPDAALTHGRVDEVRTMLQQHIPNYVAA